MDIWNFCNKTKWSETPGGLRNPLWEPLLYTNKCGNSQCPQVRAHKHHPSEPRNCPEEKWPVREYRLFWDVHDNGDESAAAQAAPPRKPLAVWLHHAGGNPPCPGRHLRHCWVSPSAHAVWCCSPARGTGPQHVGLTDKGKSQLL